MLEIRIIVSDGTVHKTTICDPRQLFAERWIRQFPGDRVEFLPCLHCDLSRQLQAASGVYLSGREVTVTEDGLGALQAELATDDGSPPMA